MDTTKTVFVDHEIGSEILSRIRDAEREIVLVSPYVTPWGRLTTELEKARTRGVHAVLYFRADYAGKLDAQTRALFHECLPIDKLHAKIYVFDDNEFLVSSMNLLESSNNGSSEIALRIVDDGQKAEIRKYILRDLIPAQPSAAPRAAPAAVAPPAAKQTPSFVAPPSTAPRPKAPPPPGPTVVERGMAQILGFLAKQMGTTKGYCIRCKDPVDLDVDRPLCTSCYKAWARYKNPEYVENHCHACGKKAKTSMLKPVCWDCYKRGEAY